MENIFGPKGLIGKRILDTSIALARLKWRGSDARTDVGADYIRPSNATFLSRPMACMLSFEV